MKSRIGRFRHSMMCFHQRRSHFRRLYILLPHLGPLDENHSRVSEDDGQVADLSVGLVLVGRPVAFALHAALDQSLHVYMFTTGDMGSPVVVEMQVVGRTRKADSSKATTDKPNFSSHPRHRNARLLGYETAMGVGQLLSSATRCDSSLGPQSPWRLLSALWLIVGM